MTPELKRYCYEVESLLEGYGYFFRRLDDWRFVARQGSSDVTVCVEELAEYTVVTVQSVVVRGAEPTAALMRALLIASEKLPFGAFIMEPNGEIQIQYRILATSLSEEGLKAALRSVALAADHYDDLVVAQAGGQRAFEQG